MICQGVLSGQTVFRLILAIIKTVTTEQAGARFGHIILSSFNPQCPLHRQYCFLCILGASVQCLVKLNRNGDVDKN